MGHLFSRAGGTTIRSTLDFILVGVGVGAAKRAGPHLAMHAVGDAEEHTLYYRRQVEDGTDDTNGSQIRSSPVHRPLSRLSGGASDRARPPARPGV
jgi:hypothetical protein